MNKNEITHPMSTPQSDTPRTDAATGWPVVDKGAVETKFLYSSPDGVMVHADFARTLERELMSAQAVNAELLMALRAALLRLEHLGSEETGPCEVTRNARAIFAKHAP